MVEMISRAQTSNTRGQLSYGASIDCKNKGRGGGLTGWKSWKKEIDEVDRRQAAQSAGRFCLGSEALGFMSVRIWRKSCSLEKKNGKKKRERDASGCVGH